MLSATTILELSSCAGLAHVAVQGTLGGHVPTSQPRSLQAETSICSFEHELEVLLHWMPTRSFCPSMSVRPCIVCSVLGVLKQARLQCKQVLLPTVMLGAWSTPTFLNVKKHIPPSAHVTVEISLQDHDVMEPPS